MYQAYAQHDGSAHKDKSAGVTPSQVPRLPLEEAELLK
jgi:hypothetical protein